MVVIGWIEVPKHGQCLNLWPTTPGSNHAHIKVAVADAVLTATSSERVCAIEWPGWVCEPLKVTCQGTAKDAGGLQLISYEFEIKEPQKPTTGWSRKTSPNFPMRKKSGPFSGTWEPYRHAMRTRARTGHSLVSASLAHRCQVCSTPVCADLWVFSCISMYAPEYDSVRGIKGKLGDSEPTLAWNDLNTCKLEGNHLLNPKQHQPHKKVGCLVEYPSQIQLWGWHRLCYLHHGLT